MAREVIRVGTHPNDETGDNIRDAYKKINRMTEELYAGMTGTNRFRGAYDLSQEEYPSTGGNGTGGIPAIGDEWYGINNGVFNVEDLGIIRLQRGATLTYIGGDVSLPASWIVKQ